MNRLVLTAIIAAASISSAIPARAESVFCSKTTMQLVGIGLPVLSRAGITMEQFNAMSPEQRVAFLVTNASAEEFSRIVEIGNARDRAGCV